MNLITKPKTETTMKSMPTSENNSSTKQPISEALKKQRGLRIRNIRDNTLYMNRKAFAKKFNIPYPTMQNWEDGRFGGLSKRGAKIIANVFTQEGIQCTPEWLLDEEGPAPKTMPKVPMHISEPQVNGYSAAQKEIKAFYENNPHAVHTTVSGNTMEPRFCDGEYVAGIQHKLEELQLLVGKDCIIHEKTGDVSVKRFIAIQSDNLLQLSTYANDKITELKLKDLLYAAPVIWCRREL